MPISEIKSKNFIIPEEIPMGYNLQGLSNSSAWCKLVQITFMLTYLAQIESCQLIHLQGLLRSAPEVVMCKKNYHTADTKIGHVRTCPP